MSSTAFLEQMPSNKVVNFDCSIPTGNNGPAKGRGLSTSHIQHFWNFYFVVPCKFAIPLYRVFQYPVNESYAHIELNDQ